MAGMRDLCLKNRGGIDQGLQPAWAQTTWAAKITSRETSPEAQTTRQPPTAEIHGAHVYPPAPQPLMARIAELEVQLARLRALEQLGATLALVIGPGIVFSAADVWEHQVLSPALTSALATAGIRNPKQLGKQLRQLTACLVRVGEDRAGSCGWWRSEFLARNSHTNRKIRIRNKSSLFLFAVVSGDRHAPILGHLRKCATTSTKAVDSVLAAR